MTTIEELIDKGFCYNSTGYMDIAFDEKTISIDKIKNDGYDIGVNHRPIRDPHVNKIKSTFIGDHITIKAVFDSRDGCYHIIQGQHVFTASIQLMSNKGDILCGIIKNKLNGVYLDAGNKEDRDICFEYSYRMTEGQERNCMADKICMVVELSDKYKEESGYTHGVVDYVCNHQYGFQKLSEGTIKQYLSYGNALKKHNLLIYAQKERWDEKMIKSRIEEYKLKKKTYKTINLKLDEETARRFIDSGLAENTLWKDVFSRKKKISKQKILDLDEE